MNKFKRVDEAVWVAIAILTYEKFQRVGIENLHIEDIYFKQNEIQQKAQSICENIVHSPRVSQHYNGDHPNCTYNFLREDINNNHRRISYNGEFNALKEKPLTLSRDIDRSINTVYGEKSIRDLIEFIDNEYTTFIKNSNKNIHSTMGVKRMDNQKNNIKIQSKNQILYGPPGTGKTYNVINRALEIIDKSKYSNIINNPLKREEVVKEFNSLLDNGQISFCTFHQSYGYEDFVEGLRSDKDGKGFTPKNGILKSICKNALNKDNKHILSNKINGNKINFFKMSLGVKGRDEDIYEYCMEHNCIVLGGSNNVDYSQCNNFEDIERTYKNIIKEDRKQFDMDSMDRFKFQMKTGDIVIISSGNKMARAIGKVTGDYRYDKDTDIDYEHFRDVEWLYINDNIDIKKILIDKQFSQQAIYRFDKSDLNLEEIEKLISDKTTGISYEKSENKNYVLIIDEINRGNISKIFGELITLIEEDKRLGEKNQLKVTLPYSNEIFGVPNNLYILGTMNTADRSIALLDTALRRRFEFIEYMPNEKLLAKDIEGINLQLLLKTINERIEFLFDREHTIGHAYFIKEDLNFEGLVFIMKNKIIPLLQEYFYGDWEKIELVLGGSGTKHSEDYFLIKEKVDVSRLFKGKAINDYQEQFTYSIVDNPSKKAFLNIYDYSEQSSEE